MWEGNGGICLLFRFDSGDNPFPTDLKANAIYSHEEVFSAFVQDRKEKKIHVCVGKGGHLI